ncbi:MAG: hypothetical protein WCQ54_12605, partial [Clostridiaceae bacterium]
MNLQSFVTSVFEAIGGIVLPVEYALCEVLIPEEYKSLFQDKSELLLAFDFEVAEENPAAEFVTFGSYILDQLLEIIKSKTISTVRYIIVDKLSLSDPADKIKKYLNINRGSIEILEEQEILAGFAALTFTTGYTVDERSEKHTEIWVDLLTGKVCEKMMECKSGIFYEEKPEGIYPVKDFVSLMSAFEAAFIKLKEIIEKTKNEYKDDDLFTNDTKRIQEYYKDLHKDNLKRMQRKGISDEKIKELQSKEITLSLEKQRQLKEIKEKYSVSVDLSLDYGIVYFMPAILYKVKITA